MPTKKTEPILTLLAKEETSLEAKALASQAHARSTADAVPLAEATIADSEEHLQQVQTSFYRGTEQFSPMELALARAAVEAAELRLKGAKRMAGDARVALRYYDSEVAQALLEALAADFPSVQMLASAAFLPTQPSMAERPLMVLTQVGPTVHRDSGRIAAEVEIHYYRTSDHLPLSTHRIESALDGQKGNITAQVSFTSSPAPQVDRVKVTVSGVAVRTPIITAIERRHHDALARAVVNELVRPALFYNETAEGDLYTGYVSSKRVEAIPFNTKLVSETVQDGVRIVVVESNIGLKLNAPLEGKQSPRAYLQDALDRLAGKSVNYLGVVENIEVLADETGSVGAGAADKIRKVSGSFQDAQTVGYEIGLGWTIRATITSSAVAQAA